MDQKTCFFNFIILIPHIFSLVLRRKSSKRWKCILLCFWFSKLVLRTKISEKNMFWRFWKRYKLKAFAEWRIWWDILLESERLSDISPLVSPQKQASEYSTKLMFSKVHFESSYSSWDGKKLDSKCIRKNISFRGAKYWYTYELFLLRPKKARLKMNSGKHEKILGTGSRFPCFNYRNHYRIPLAELTNVLGVSRKMQPQPPGNKKVWKPVKTPKNKYRNYLRET